MKIVKYSLLRQWKDAESGDREKGNGLSSLLSTVHLGNGQRWKVET